jgi:hypothetical protein
MDPHGGTKCAAPQPPGWHLGHARELLWSRGRRRTTRGRGPFLTSPGPRRPPPRPAAAPCHPPWAPRPWRPRGPRPPASTAGAWNPCCDPSPATCAPQDRAAEWGTLPPAPEVGTPAVAGAPGASPQVLGGKREGKRSSRKGPGVACRDLGLPHSCPAPSSVSDDAA